MESLSLNSVKLFIIIDYKPISGFIRRILSAEQRMKIKLWSKPVEEDISSWNQYVLEELFAIEYNTLNRAQESLVIFSCIFKTLILEKRKIIFSHF